MVRKAIKKASATLERAADLIVKIGIPIIVLRDIIEMLFR